MSECRRCHGHLRHFCLLELRMASTAAVLHSELGWAYGRLFEARIGLPFTMAVCVGLRPWPRKGRIRRRVKTDRRRLLLIPPSYVASRNSRPRPRWECTYPSESCVTFLLLDFFRVTEPQPVPDSSTRSPSPCCPLLSRRNSRFVPRLPRCLYRSAPRHWRSPVCTANYTLRFAIAEASSLVILLPFSQFPQMLPFL